ncbi:MAG: hypothetical protein PHE27_04595, partial [Alphaproteobacteria bacterium]|nr:hypothetical protein [Alphaproteobacteria bacterium]
MDENAHTPQNEIAETRSAMDLRLGEIIEAVLGDARIRELFEKAGKHPDEYKDRPTGELALKPGVIDAETKPGLLVAQAAERPYRLAIKIIEATEWPVPKGKELADGQTREGFVSYDDPLFKFVGSKKDPEILRYAQGIWMAAQMVYNQAMPNVVDREFGIGFQVAAKELYAAASEIMGDNGHTAAAKKFMDVSAAMPITGKTCRPPHRAMIWLKFGLSLESLRHLPEGYNSVAYKQTIGRLVELTKPFEKAPKRPKTLTPFDNAPQITSPA